MDKPVRRNQYPKAKLGLQSREIGVAPMKRPPGVLPAGPKKPYTKLNVCGVPLGALTGKITFPSRSF